MVLPVIIALNLFGFADDLMFSVLQINPDSTEPNEVNWSADISLGPTHGCRVVFTTGPVFPTREQAVDSLLGNLNIFYTCGRLYWEDIDFGAIAENEIMALSPELIEWVGQQIATDDCVYSSQVMVTV